MMQAVATAICAGYRTAWQARTALVGAFAAPFFFSATLLALLIGAYIWIFAESVGGPLQDQMDDMKRIKLMSSIVTGLVTIALGIGLASWARHRAAPADAPTQKGVTVVRMLAGIGLAWALTSLFSALSSTVAVAVLILDASFVPWLPAFLLLCAGCIAAIALVMVTGTATSSTSAVIRSLTADSGRQLLSLVAVFALTLVAAMLVLALVQGLLFRWLTLLIRDSMAYMGAVQFIRNLVEWILMAFVGAATIAALRAAIEGERREPAAASGI